ncbi:hypothetical protein [Streptomyces mexicanus]|uniref:hypothetical protein n=1 Tax=Streptomyces mexicanus TaxID=178566 RepID=UPI003668EA9B
MTVTRYRKKPVEVDTIQWTGDNETDVQAFTGRQNFYALDDADRAGSDDPEATATVYDKLHSTWVLVYTGQHIVRGVKGEFYPIAEDVLAETYEPADSAPPADRATVLREAYEIAYAEGMRLNALEAEIGAGPYRGALAVAHLLRKAISEAQQAGAQR